VQSSILMVSSDEVLSNTRALLLKHWQPLVVSPEVAPYAIAARSYDLLIICQTVAEEVAAKLALQITMLCPNAKVMAINGDGQVRSFRAVQVEVDVAHPAWLPSAVSSVLSADDP
jgi:hypothetical protein